MSYKVRPRTLTPNTTVYDVVMGEKIVCTCGREVPASNIARVFTEKNVIDIPSYKQLPGDMRMAFVNATSQALPNF